MFGLGKYHLTEQKIFLSSTISNPNISITSLLEYFKKRIIMINLGIYNNFNSNLEKIMSNFFIQLVLRVDTSPKNCLLIASNVYQFFFWYKRDSLFDTLTRWLTSVCGPIRLEYQSLKASKSYLMR